MSRPAPYTTGDLLMEVELLKATLEHHIQAGTKPDPDSFKPLLREAAVRGAWRILDYTRLADQINEIGEQP